MSILSDVIGTIEGWFASLPKEVQDYLERLKTDEGSLLQRLALTAVQDVVSAGFTSASFVTAGKDIVAQALAQGKTIAINDAIAQVNILAAPLRTAAPAVEPTTAPVETAPAQ